MDQLILHLRIHFLKSYNLILFILVHFQVSQAQMARPDSSSRETTSKFTLGGYIDSYLGYSFNKTKDNTVPYMINSANHNALSINLAYLDLRYISENFRLVLSPGLGSYMKTNYAVEKGIAKHLFEARLGFKIWPKKGIWLDAGVFSSPYTNESAVSKDHLMYTRSLAPEYVPYYLAGGKLSMPINKKINMYLYLLNGWQQIGNLNQWKAIGTQLEWKHNDKGTLTWNNYVGNERNTLTPANRMRYFTDIYYVYNPDGNFSFTTCAYVGVQEQIDNGGKMSYPHWWQANFIGRYRFSPHFSLSGRIEYFDDPGGVQIKSIVSDTPFSSFSTGLCLNVNVKKNILFRTEGRYFFSSRSVFSASTLDPASKMCWLVSSLTAWF